MPVSALPGVGLAPDRLLTSHTPGPVTNREAITVALAPDGAPVVVTLDQRLRLTGVGDYQVRERGPARQVRRVGDTVAPVLKLGTVVWLGFSPGHRELAARLTLDAGLEAPRLPMAVRLVFRDAAGQRRALLPGGRAPSPGTLTVTLVNQSAATVTVPTGRAAAADLAGPLTTLLAAARHPRAGPLPTGGAGLPATIPATLPGQRRIAVVAPLRVTGTIRASQGRVTGPGTTPTTGGARVTGVLTGSAAFTVELPRPGAVAALDLSVRPALDPRVLAPPAPFPTWRAWASAGPSPAARAAATARLVGQAAAAARAASYVPYLGADLHGPSTTTFRYVVAPPPAAVSVSATREVNPHAVVAALAALVGVVVNLGLLWRAS